MVWKDNNDFEDDFKMTNNTENILKIDPFTKLISSLKFL